MVEPVSDMERPGGRPVANAAILAAVLVAGALMAYWLTLPPERYALDDRCAPEDLAAGLSAWFYGPAFWKQQQAALADELKTMQELRNEAKEGRGRDLIMTPIEQRMRRLSDKERADLAAGDEAAWRRQMLRLGQCESVVAARLAP